MWMMLICLMEINWEIFYFFCTSASSIHAMLIMNIVLSPLFVSLPDCLSSMSNVENNIDLQVEWKRQQIWDFLPKFTEIMLWLSVESSNGTGHSLWASVV